MTGKGGPSAEDDARPYEKEIVGLIKELVVLSAGAKPSYRSVEPSPE